MTERLATWVWVGAAALACVAGMVNVVGYLGFEHQAITHLTGTTSLLGAALAQGNLPHVLQLGAMLLAFVGGAVLSGLLIQDSTLRLGRRYGVALAIEAVLLALAVPLFERGSFAGPVLAAVAIGLQNAMATTYSGAIVRTSHVSGMFTDLGITLGHAMRGLPVPRRRLWLCLVIIASFLAGGVGGALMFGMMQYRALYLPAMLTGAAGVGYVVYRHHALQRASSKA
ncbi:YoaK family protein [Arenimonas sp. MALMAid1274]|uniref:YoaK family protein n=1 Tax=Arenimonas sp. MALMAid1274 TaxID=3411630 RepID=UPI003BA17893